MNSINNSSLSFLLSGSSEDLSAKGLRTPTDSMDVEKQNPYLSTYLESKKVVEEHIRIYHEMYKGSYSEEVFKRLVNYKRALQIGRELKDASESTDLTFSYVKDCVDKDVRRFIFSQTDECFIAPHLKSALLLLSHRLTIDPSFDHPKGHVLGAKINGCAQGIFNVGTKPDWSDILPDDMIKEIFWRCVSKGPYDVDQKCSKFEAIFVVSKKWHALAHEVRDRWRENTELFCVFSSDELTLTDISDFVSSQNLTTCALSLDQLEEFEVDQLDTMDTTQLGIKDIKPCQYRIEKKTPWKRSSPLALLIIQDYHSCPAIIDIKIVNKTRLPLVTALPMLSMIDEKLFRFIIEQVPNLEKLSIFHCEKEVVNELVNVINLNKISNLRFLDLTWCHVTANQLNDIFKKTSNLRELTLDFAKELVDVLTKAPSTLEYVTFAMGLTDEEDESVQAAVENLRSCAPNVDILYHYEL